MRIKKFLRNLNVFKTIKVLRESVKGLTYSIEEFRKENYMIKGQLMKRRKILREANEQLVTAVNDLNLLGEQLDIVEEKKARASKVIAQCKKRQKEFLKRIKSSSFAGINSLADYKYFLSEPFIKDKYDVFISEKMGVQPADIDMIKIFKKTDEEKTDDFTTP